MKRTPKTSQQCDEMAFTLHVRKMVEQNNCKIQISTVLEQCPHHYHLFAVALFMWLLKTGIFKMRLTINILKLRKKAHSRPGKQKHNPSSATT